MGLWPKLGGGVRAGSEGPIEFIWLSEMSKQRVINYKRAQIQRGGGGQKSFGQRPKFTVFGFFEASPKYVWDPLMIMAALELMCVYFPIQIINVKILNSVICVLNLKNNCLNLIFFFSEIMSTIENDICGLFSKGVKSGPHMWTSPLLH